MSGPDRGGTVPARRDSIAPSRVCFSFDCAPFGSAFGSEAQARRQGKLSPLQGSGLLGVFVPEAHASGCQLPVLRTFSRSPALPCMRAGRAHGQAARQDIRGIRVIRGLRSAGHSCSGRGATDTTRRCCPCRGPWRRSRCLSRSCGRGSHRRFRRSSRLRSAGPARHFGHRPART